MKVIVFVMLCLFPLAGRAWQGRVLSVQDGDSLTVLSGDSQVRIRLYGVDAPEKDQPGGDTSRDFLLERISGRMVEIMPQGTDSYGRTLALVYERGTNLNELMVQSGQAWVYTGYCKKDFCLQWYLSEKQARQQGLGLWAVSAPIPPWAWRQGQRPRSLPHSLNSTDRPWLGLVIILLAALGILPLLRRNLYRNFMKRKLRKK